MAILLCVSEEQKKIYWPLNHLDNKLQIGDSKVLTHSPYSFKKANILGYCNPGRQTLLQNPLVSLDKSRNLVVVCLCILLLFLRHGTQVYCRYK